MTVQHEILQFNPALGAIAVRYYTAAFPDGFVYWLDLPIVDGAYPSETEVRSLIEQFKPVGQLERVSALTSVKSNAFLDNLPAVNATSSDTADTAVQMRIKRTALLNMSDWAVMPDNGLSEERRSVWLAYRAALRDVPAQSGFPTNIQWPAMPEPENDL